MGIKFHELPAARGVKIPAWAWLEYPEPEECLRELVAWADMMGGFEAPAWARARRVVAEIVRNAKRRERLDRKIADKCPSCGEARDESANSTHQQWECCCCGSWNDRGDA